MEKKSKPAAKEKRRNNEKRKEKSRDAARCRRSRETEIFTDLAHAIPLSKESAGQLDKASIMRLAISYFRARDMLTMLPEIPSPVKSTEDESVFLQALEGFVMVISDGGELVYLSENVNEYLGITQIDLLGQNILEYTHPCDHSEIKDILESKSTDTPKSFFIRLKCTLTSRGRSVNLKSASYKVIHCTGHIVNREIKDRPKKYPEGKPVPRLSQCLVAIGQPIPHPSNIEVPLDKKTFLTKHSLDMKYTYADDKMLEVLGYDPEDLIGQSVYGYHHAMDSDSINSNFKSLFTKGQCETGKYRLLAKTGGFVWVVTQATLIYDKMQKPQSVVCVNYVISGVECKNEIYSASQLSSVKSETESVCSPEQQVQEITSTYSPDIAEQILDIEEPEDISEKIFSTTLDAPPRPQTATSKIFAPRTKEMSKGFLMFSDEEPGLTMLKDEPDDLTHLAPTAGDVCIPLEDNPIISDMLNDFLGENYCPLFADDIQSIDSDECSKTSDPVISYHEEYDDSSTSPHLLSPTLSKSSECTVPSLCSPGNSLIEDEHMNTFILQMDEDEQPEFTKKVPTIIDMTTRDNLPLLRSNDLMWNAIPNEKLIKDDKPDLNSTLAHYLSVTAKKNNIKSNDHGGGLIRNEDTTKRDDYKKVRQERTNKRMCNYPYDPATKRTKNEPREKLSPELFQQLISHNNQRQRTKSKNSFIIDSGGKTQAACEEGPPDIETVIHIPVTILEMFYSKTPDVGPPRIQRKNSASLLYGQIPSLVDLTQQDCEVNAPVNNLLQGQELTSALDNGHVC